MDGRFRFVGIGAGVHVLFVSTLPSPWFPPDAVRGSRGDEDVEIRLREGGAARVRVLDPTGEPVPEAQVYVSLHTSTRREARTDESCVAAVAGLHAGRPYELRAGPPPDGKGLGWAESRNWDVSDTTLRLPHVWPLRIHLVDRDGEGIAGRRLAALADIPVIDLTPDVRVVAGEILRLGGMPAKAYIDAVHVAVAAAHGIDIPADAELHSHREPHASWYGHVGRWRRPCGARRSVRAGVHLCASCL